MKKGSALLTFHGKDRALSVVDVAEHLGVNAETVKVWIRERQLAAFRMGKGGKLWVTPADLDAFIRRRAV